MKKVSQKVVLIIIGLFIIGALILAGQAQARNRWADLFAGFGNKDIAGYVNGEPFTVQEWELAKNAKLIDVNPSEADVQRAYKQALDGLIRHRVLVQEARRRGLTVGMDEARSYLTEIQNQEKQFPELMEMHEQQRKALGLTEEQYEERLLVVYQETLLVEKLYDLWAAEAPTPTEAEVDLFLANQPGQNVLVLIPLSFDNLELGRQVYQELQTLAAGLPVEQFEISLAETVYRYSALKPGAFLHEKYIFDNEAELPDYAKAALGQPERTLGLFERSDGSAVIYYILKSVTTSAEEARARAYHWLNQEKRLGYALDMEKQLMEQAKVEFIVENLPEEALSVIEQ